MTYYCTNCGADLEEQDGFDPSAEYWECTNCGTMLTDPNIDDSDSMYPGVVWVCDSCGAILNKQSGFTDYLDSWVCTECGHVNPISESEIYSSNEEWEASQSASYYSENNSDEQESDEESLGSVLGEAIVNIATAKIKAGIAARNAKYDTQDEEDDDEEYYAEDEDDDDVYVQNPSTSQVESNKSNKGLVLLFIAIIIIGLGYFCFQKWQMLTPTRIASEECIGVDYVKIVSEFKAAGFENVHAVALDDLDYQQLSQNSLVSGVKIGNETEFKVGKKFYSDSDVYVYYHSPRIVSVPLTSKDAKGQLYTDVEKLFRDAGFENIELIKNEDLMFGILNKENCIESVTINDESKFDTSAKQPIDAKIVITYHAFKNREK